MIQIVLKDKSSLQQEYIKTVGIAALTRLRCLRISLDHIRGIKLSTTEDGFTGYKSTTEDLVNLTAKKKMANSDFNKEIYEEAVQEYIDHGELLGDAAINAAVSFVDDMCAKNGEKLNELLLCSPEQLLDMNKRLKSQYKIGSGVPLQIIKVAFNYPGCELITNAVKKFFYSAGITKYCAYCNARETTYVEGATIYELDHFFGKAENTLLCYSLFNLIPADDNCNGQINKGSIPFNNKYFLNPHIAGFGNGLQFKPIGDGQNIQRIDLVTTGSPGEELYDKMVGEGGKIDMSSKSGNINVFKLERKYNEPGLLEEASTIARKISRRAAGRRAMVDFFKRFGKDISKEAHSAWYKEELVSEFDEHNFNDARRSKLYRDIHDDIFSKDTRWFNNDIRRIIAQRYAP